MLGFVLVYRFTGYLMLGPAPVVGAGGTQESWMKNMQRALRRHHVARLKAKRRFHWRMDLRHEPRRLGIAIHTPCPCSCWMCGNPRRHLNEPTWQERRFEAHADLTTDLQCRDTAG